MNQESRARYVGDIAEYVGQDADIKPHFDTLHLELEERKVLVRWRNPNLINQSSKLNQAVGFFWHLMPAKDFKLLVMA